MYSTCIFCNQPLGSNEVLEVFPVGRRVAFDAGQGRLWVICKSCERWNLSPLDDRLEIIDECERAFGSTRMRVSTENIGLARLPDGLELVRVGRPMRPEFAAWRYGDQFGRRRRNRMVIAGIGVGAVGVIAVGGALAGIAIGSFGGLGVNMLRRVIGGNPNAVVARLRAGEQQIKVKRKHLSRIKLIDSSEGFGLEVPVKKSMVAINDDAAQQAIAQLMPAINRFGGTRRTVRDAIGLLEGAGDPQAYIAQTATTAARQYKRLLAKQPYAVRLALEMAAHEDAERRALEGELQELAQAWREAEEIAAISDSLFTPRSILEKIEAWRR